MSKCEVIQKFTKGSSWIEKNSLGEAEVRLDKDSAKIGQKQGTLADTISSGKDISSIGEHM